MCESTHTASPTRPAHADPSMQAVTPRGRLCPPLHRGTGRRHHAALRHSKRALGEQLVRRLRFHTHERVTAAMNPHTHPLQI